MPVDLRRDWLPGRLAPRPYSRLASITPTRLETHVYFGRPQRKEQQYESTIVRAQALGRDAARRGIHRRRRKRADSARLTRRTRTGSGTKPGRAGAILAEPTVVRA